MGASYPGLGQPNWPPIQAKNAFWRAPQRICCWLRMASLPPQKSRNDYFRIRELFIFWIISLTSRFFTFFRKRQLTAHPNTSLLSVNIHDFNYVFRGDIGDSLEICFTILFQITVTKFTMKQLWFPNKVCTLSLEDIWIIICPLCHSGTLKYYFVREPHQRENPIRETPLACLWYSLVLAGGIVSNASISSNVARNFSSILHRIECLSIFCKDRFRPVVSQSFVTLRESWYRWFVYG